MTDQTPEPTGPRERDPGQARRRPWWPGAVVAAVAVVVAVGLAVPVARELLHDEPATPVRGAPWEQLPKPPANEVLGGPEVGPAVWTGTELILLARSTVAAGSAQLPDGLAYAPATRRWRVLPDPPPDLSLRGGPVGAVWTGREVIVVRSAGPPIAYDPDADAWRPLAPLPHGVVSNLDPAPVWTGAEVLVWNAGGRDQAADEPVDGGTGAAYDPRTDRWRRLPRSPLSHRTSPVVAWTGRELLVIGGGCGELGHDRCQDGAAYDPAADTWVPVPAPAGGAMAFDAASAWTGSELVVWSETRTRNGQTTGSTASAYRPRGRRWRTLPAAPIAPRRLPGLVWTGDRLLLWGGIRETVPGRYSYPDDGAAYDPRGNRWRRLARAPAPGRALPLTAWTGDWAIFVGGVNVGVQPREDRGNIAAITEQGVAYWPAGG